LDRMHESEGVLVARSHHAGRRPGGDVQAAVVETAPTNFQRVDQLGEPRRILLAGLVGRKARIEIACEGLADQPEKARVYVGEAICDEIRRELPLEVLLLKGVMKVFQAVNHRPETVE